MDLAADHGQGWRATVSMRLRSKGWRVFSPTENPAESDTARERRAALKAAGNWHAFSREMTEVRNVDLGQIALSDIVIMQIEPGVGACGTFFEAAYAKSLRKPVYVHCPRIQQINDWLFAELPWERFYDSFDCLLAELEASKVAA